MSDEPGQPGPAESSGAGVPPATGPKVRRADPWAHRRGEPRIFVFAWTLFLFAATVSTFVAAQNAGIADRSIVRGAARLLVFAATLGVTVLWPMVRLSQWPDPRPVRGTFRDLVVLLVPVQAMLWPQAMWWLARWPLPVVGAIDLLMLAWALVIGGVLALAQAWRLRAWRAGHPWPAGRTAAAMILMLFLSTGGALVALTTGPDPLATPDVHAAAFRVSWMLSPLTGIFEIAHDRTWSGVAAAITPAHIVSLLIVGCAGVPAWLWALRVERGLRAPTGLH